MMPNCGVGTEPKGFGVGLIFGKGCKIRPISRGVNSAAGFDTAPHRMLNPAIFQNAAFSIDSVTWQSKSLLTGASVNRGFLCRS